MSDPRGDIGAVLAVSAEQVRTIEELRATGRECALHGTQQVEAGSPVAAREWFDAAEAAFRAACELETLDKWSYGDMSKPRPRRVYSAAEHERLLQHQQACWDRMHAIGQELGRDGREYENALQAVIAARWAIGVETRKRRLTTR